ncbi:XRE family transcriptional regulator [Streptomyces sp. NPDC046915]|uniref:XRE family transcriptional regulator n=1 Tax=Streptomyces sp. NPDC046915 TaxID=3155257 RepID=UPI003401D69A
MSAFRVPVDPDLVIAWENGSYRPTEHELFALADVLWCRTIELMGIEKPRSMAELRLARQFTVTMLAESIGMGVAEYEEAERLNQWRGNCNQTLALLNALDLSLPEVLGATGQSEVQVTAIPLGSRTSLWTRVRAGRPDARAADPRERTATPTNDRSGRAVI